MTRVRIPAGLHVAAGDYDIGARSTAGRRRGTSEAGQHDFSRDWDELREVPGVEIECSRHPGLWWPTAGKNIRLNEVPTWRCRNCAWAFRQGLAGQGGTPQF
jgi:hypothetical protein